MEKKYDLGLYFYGPALGGVNMKSICTKVLFWLFVFGLQAPIANAQPVVAPIQDNTAFVLGPYPVEANVDGIQGTFYSWMKFTPSQLGRGSPTYRLTMELYVQVSALKHMVNQKFRLSNPQDNCERVNNFDNWSYTLTLRDSVIRQNIYALNGSGNATAWTCIEGIPETVCDYYSSLLGQVPYNCRLRQNLYKSINHQHGYDFSKKFGLEVRNKELHFRNFNAITSSDPNDILFSLISLLNNFSAIYKNAFMEPTVIKAHVPEEFSEISAGYSDAGFAVYNGEPFIFAVAYVETDLNFVRQFMAKYFPERRLNFLPSERPLRLRSDPNYRPPVPPLPPLPLPPPPR
jgi:hypothetical protein